MRSLAVETIGLIPGWSWLLVVLVGIYYCFSHREKGENFLVFFLGMLVVYIDNFLGFAINSYSIESGFFRSLPGVFVIGFFAVIVFGRKWWILLAGYLAMLVFDGDVFSRVVWVTATFIGAFLLSYLSYRENMQGKPYDYSSAKEAEKYSKNRFKGKSGEMIDVFERDIICNFIGGKRWHGAVDLGAGTGRVSLHLLDCARIDKLVLVDVSDQMLLLAKSNLKNRSEKLNFVKRDATRTGFKNNSFDLTVSFHLVKHVADLDSLVHEISRITKKGGFVLAEVTNSHSLAWFWRNGAKLRSYGEVMRVAEKHGLVREAVSGCNIFGESVYWLIPVALLSYFYKFDRLVSSMLTFNCSKIIFLFRKI